MLLINGSINDKSGLSSFYGVFLKKSYITSSKNSSYGIDIPLSYDKMIWEQPKKMN